VATASREGCFVVNVVAGLAGSAATELAHSGFQGPPSPNDVATDVGVNLVVAAVSCLLFSPALVVNSSVAAVAVTLELVTANAIAGAAVATLAGEHFHAFAKSGGGGGGGGGDASSTTQTKRLSRGEIKKLKDAGLDPEELKGGKATGKLDLFKDQQGNIIVKPKDGSGPGDSLGININNL
jgi:hypothetical protein